MINRLWKRIAVLGVILVVTVVLMVQVVAAQEITPYPGIIYISTDAAGMTDDGVAYDAYDIVGRVPYLNGGSPTADDAYAWFKLFDGEDYGLSSVHNINGFSIEWAEMVPCGGIGVDCVAPEPPASPLDDVEALYLSFDFTARHVPGITGKVRGQDIVVHAALKPTSSIQVPGRSIDIDGNPVEVVTTGRHDPCVGIRATPIAEAMLAIVLLDHFLRHRGQNADVFTTTPDIAAAGRLSS